MTCSNRRLAARPSFWWIYASWGMLLLSLLLGGPALKAQTPTSGPLSLAQCLEKALVNNANVRTALIDAQVAEQKVKEVKASVLPQANLNADYKHYFKLPAQVIPASAFGGPAGEFREAAFGMPWNLGNTAQVSQTLFNASLFNAMKASRLVTEINDLQVAKTKQDVAYQVSAAYYNAQTLARQQAFLRANAKSFERLVAATELLVDNQLARRTDVDKLRLNKAALDNQVLALEATRQQLLNLLKWLMAVPQDQPLEVETAPDLPVGNAPERVGPGSASRLEIALLGKQQEVNLLEQRNIRDGFLPVLNAYGVYNYTGFAKGGEANYFKFFPGYWAGIQLNWNVFDGGVRRQKLAGKRLEGEKLNVQLAQFGQNVQMELANAQAQQKVQREALALNQAQVALAERVFGQTQLQFKEGTASITDVIQAENALREAQTNYSTAYIKLMIAELDQRKAAGTLLE
jgi:outer membrane protein